MNTNLWSHKFSPYTLCLPQMVHLETSINAYSKSLSKCLEHLDICLCHVFFLSKIHVSKIHVIAWDHESHQDFPSCFRLCTSGLLQFARMSTSLGARAGGSNFTVLEPPGIKRRRSTVRARPRARLCASSGSVVCSSVGKRAENTHARTHTCARTLELQERTVPSCYYRLCPGSFCNRIKWVSLRFSDGGI